MRLTQRRLLATGIGVVALALAAAACKDSNSVAGPMTAAPVMSIAGSWSGTYQPNSTDCSASAASATVYQQGDQITGVLTSSACGMSGNFKGQMVGDRFVGRVDMAGCSGGGASGSIANSMLTLRIEDLTRPLVTDQEIVKHGGTVELHR
jgi:hypothetical protein